MAVEVNHEIYSSAELGGIQVGDQPKDMCGPASSAWTRRSTTSSARWSAPIVAPATWRTWRALSASGRARPRRAAAQRDIRLGRAGLDRADHPDAGDAVRLPVRGARKLTYWSDVDDRQRHRPGRAGTFRGRTPRRAAGDGRVHERLLEPAGSAPPRFDLISMLAHGEATREMPCCEFMGKLDLLIVGGNDTTRNSMSGGVLALKRIPKEYDKLRADPGADPQHGAGDHPLANAGHPHAPHRRARRRARRQEDQGGRQGRHVVRLGQPRRGRHRRSGRASSSTGRGRASICRSASASIAAWATGWPSCSCASSGKR